MGVKGLIYKRKILGYVFLLPMAVLLCTFMYYPIGNSIFMSFTNWSGFELNYDFIGLRNYERLFFEMPEYWQAMWVNIRFATISTTIQTILGFFLAVGVLNLTRRWQDFFKISLYLPVILPAAVVAIMWRFIYTPDFGLINQLLRAMSLDSWARAWTADPTWALPAVIFTNTWRYVGFTMVLYYVSLLGIPTEMLESAQVDGATYWQRIRYFYFPLTRGTTEINFVLSITGGLRAFDMFFLLTQGGPGGRTKVVGMWILETAFQSFRFGRALAMSIILFLIVVTAMLISRFILAPRHDN